MNTEQMEFWKGQFGKEYTERNILNPDDLDDLYKRQYGLTRSDMNRGFLDSITFTSALEVGCNVGNQLRLLKQQFASTNWCGIELQRYAVERAREISPGIDIIQGSAFDIIFKDESFDLVFTSGVLIHIAPDDVGKVMDEIYRTSKRYIWGMEYFAEQWQHIPYRGHESKMWKTNYAKLYLERFPSLRLVKEEKYKYIHNENIDQMFLLEKV